MLVTSWEAQILVTFYLFWRVFLSFGSGLGTRFKVFIIKICTCPCSDFFWVSISFQPNASAECPINSVVVCVVLYGK